MDYAKESLRLHKEWKGKIEVKATVPVATKEDLSLAYTPVVAQPWLRLRSMVIGHCLAAPLAWSVPQRCLGPLEGGFHTPLGRSCHLRGTKAPLGDQGDQRRLCRLLRGTLIPSTPKEAP